MFFFERTSDAMTFDARHNFYSILNCDATSSIEEIRNQYRVQLLRTHPDKLSLQRANAGDVASNVVESQQRREFELVHAAWQVLSNDEQRKLYDRFLLELQRNPTGKRISHSTTATTTHKQQNFLSAFFVRFFYCLSFGLLRSEPTADTAGWR